MTPLERMARAACEADFRKTFPEILDGQPTVDRDWPRYLPQMRAALAAIEVPSEGMNVAAREWSRRKYGKPIGSDASEGCWTAMIRAAWEEGP